jgi:hypothetical protein
MTLKELSDKVTYEGGAFAALQYGIRSRDIADPQVAALWLDLEESYEALSPICWRLDSLLKQGK